MTSVKLNAGSIMRVYEFRAIKWINNALPVLLEELKRLTPEDTKEMLNSYVVHNATTQWNKVIWTIGNTSWHAIYVEYWEWWVSFNYHKPKWSTIYRWQGNRTFARAVDNKRAKVIQIIFNEINR